VTSLKLMSQSRPMSEFQKASEERNRSPWPLKSLFRMGMKTRARGMPPAMVCTMTRLPVAGSMVSSFSITAARLVRKRSVPRSLE